MDDVFDFRNRLIGEYSSFSRSFSRLQHPTFWSSRREYARGRYWPEPLIQINPNYKRSGTVQQLAKDGVLHRIARISRLVRPKESRQSCTCTCAVASLARHRTSKVSSSPLARAAANRCRFHPHC